MKKLNDLDNTSKARLLHDLFPDEIPALIENLKQVCADFKGRNRITEVPGILYWSALSSVYGYLSRPQKY